MMTLMQLAPYVQALQQDLAAAAAVAGDDPSREAGNRLAQAIEPALHLRLLDLLGELSLALTGQVPGRVEVRLVGREPELVYVEEEEEPEPAHTAGVDDSFSARITLRLPEGLKAQIEVAASTEGASVNTWIVRALQRALEPRTRSVRTGRRLTGFADS
jgi:HicB family